MLDQINEFENLAEWFRVKAENIFFFSENKCFMLVLLHVLYTLHSQLLCGKRSLVAVCVVLVIVVALFLKCAYLSQINALNFHIPAHSVKWTCLNVLLRHTAQAMAKR